MKLVSRLYENILKRLFAIIIIWLTLLHNHIACFAFSRFTKPFSNLLMCFYALVMSKKHLHYMSYGIKRKIRNYVLNLLQTNTTITIKYECYQWVRIMSFIVPTCCRAKTMVLLT